jgi:hypothetical protein
VSRFSAFAIHLAISFIIFLALAYLVVFEWYPGILFDADGGWRGMRIIIGVDLVLGPALTLVAFKHGKPGLKFDLACIALLQTVCLTTGTYVVWSERPLAVVYVDSRFETLARDDFTDFSFTVPNFGDYTVEDPAWIAVNLPSDLDELSVLRRKMFKMGAPLTTAQQFYQRFNPLNQKFIDQARDMSRPQKREEWANAEQQWLARHGGAMKDYSFYTFSTRYIYRYIGFRRETGENLGFLDLQPKLALRIPSSNLPFFTVYTMGETVSVHWAQWATHQ